MEFRQRCARREYQLKSLIQGGSLKVVEHLEGETRGEHKEEKSFQRRAQRGEAELLRIL
jgi:hypothetical protein